MSNAAPNPYGERLLHDLQANSFVLVDLQLYLDTHPDDETAFQDFVAFSKRQRLLKRSYEEQFGPLNHYGESTLADMQAWIFAPWPWEL